MPSLPRPADVRCAEAARERGDSFIATAGPATGWVLIEHPGPWPAQIADLPELDTPSGRRLFAAASHNGVRVLLVRRVRRRGEPVPQAPRRVAVCDQRQGRTWWSAWQRDDDLVAAAELIEWLGARAGGVREGPTSGQDEPGRDERWQVADEPVLLVCTHAQHDPCCALYGRRVADSLAERFAAQTWQCSHLGGDRFAANLLFVPSGTLYGGLDADGAPECVERELAGLSPMTEYLRGISGLSAPVNAALTVVWQTLPGVGRDGIRVRSSRRLDDGAVRVELEVPPAAGRAGVAVVDVRPERDEPTYLTCHARHTAPPLNQRAEIVELR